MNHAFVTRPSHDDRRVEWRRDRRVQEVEQVGRRWSESLDLVAIERSDGLEYLRFRVAARARVEERGERQLVLPVLIDVRDAQLRLPEPRVIRAPEHRPLFRDRADDGLE